MANVNLVDKKISLSQKEIIKFQLVVHCFLKDIQLSNNELDCLTLLGLSNVIELATFCETIADSDIFKTPQTVRNFLSRAGRLGLVVKNGSTKKTVSLNETLQIQTNGNIVLALKAFYVTKEQ
jgi:hypothetical protein